jgi:hypothetical protein
LRVGSEGAPAVAEGPILQQPLTDPGRQKVSGIDARRYLLNGCLVCGHNLVARSARTAAAGMCPVARAVRRPTRAFQNLWDA